MNGELEDIFIKINKNRSILEFTFDGENQLVSSQEVVMKNDECIEITYLPEFNIRDSIYYKKDKQVKFVSVTPEMKTIEITQYDPCGNPLSMEKNAPCLRSRQLKETFYHIRKRSNG